MPNERKYNSIFGKLVEEPNDFIGLLAYGIYKREKIAFIDRFCKTNGRGPNDDELQNFHDQTLSRIDQYRRIAEVDLSEFQTELIAEQAKELSEEYDRRLKNELSNVKTSWWAAITQSFLGSIAFSVFLGVLVVIILGMRYGIQGILQEGIKMLTGQ